MIKIKDGDYLELPFGATITVTSHRFHDETEVEGIIYGKKGNYCHVYTGDNESRAEMEVCLYDNLKLEIHGTRKENPLIILKGDEWSCRLQLDFSDSSNIRVVTKRREE